MTVKAKFHVVSKIERVGSTAVEMAPVYHRNDPDHENSRFWQATPSGKLEMHITNQSAANAFEVGGEYMLTFERVPAEVTRAA